MHQFPFISAPMPIIPETVLRQHNVYQPGDTRFTAASKAQIAVTYLTELACPSGNGALVEEAA